LNGWSEACIWNKRNAVCGNFSIDLAFSLNYIPIALLSPLLSMPDIRATFRAISQQHEQCAITGKTIHPQQMMCLGLTINGAIVPLLLEDSLSQSSG
jgi:hypothetical protein